MGIDAKMRRRWVVAGLAAVVAVALGVAVFAAYSARETPSIAQTVRPTLASPTATPTPSPSPEPVGFAANTTQYSTADLAAVGVFSVNGALPIDDDPFGAPTGLVAQPIEAGAPVFADPEGEPVAYLPHTQTYDGTIVPVVELQEHWVKVLLVGRQGVPPEGNSAQTVGWMRAADVTVTEQPTYVNVSIAERTIDIVGPDGSERVATDFGWGTPETPTPLGRSFVMMTRIVPEFDYTRGHPIVYLSSQSPTLAGFGGAEVAITAFHYHDAHSGDISNGCLRLDADGSERLGQLPPGTVVYVHP